jgi:dethiobiotin synthetase
MRGIFVAGSDTGVGKTEISRAICALLLERGLAPRPLKPVETGCEPDHPEDALALQLACQTSLPLDEICPYRFGMPAAPLVAAEAEGREVDVLAIETLVARISQTISVEAAHRSQTILVEAAGGLLVPLAFAPRNLEQTDPADAPPARAMITNLDLAERLGLPVVLVGRAGLGTLNHCALSAAALVARGLNLAGIVLNRVTAEDDPSVESNPRWLKALSGARIFGPTPFVRDASKRPAELRATVSPLIDTLLGGR